VKRELSAVAKSHRRSVAGLISIPIRGVRGFALQEG
jgi:hypothetical protein